MGVMGAGGQGWECKDKGNGQGGAAEEYNGELRKGGQECRNNGQGGEVKEED